MDTGTDPCRQLGRLILLDHSPDALPPGRVQDLPVAEPEGDVVAVADEVASPQLVARNRHRHRLLLVGVARDEPSKPAIRHMDEAGTVDALLGQSAPLVRTAEVRTRLLDRVPVVVVGKVNPRFKSGGLRGGDSRRRRGALALGVVSGPAGGKRSTKAAENYYHVPRTTNWGHLGDAIHGPIMRDAELAYLHLYVDVLTAHGFAASDG